MSVYTDFFIAKDTEVKNCEQFSEGVPEHFESVSSKGITPDVLAYLQSRITGKDVETHVKTICETEDSTWVFQISDFLYSYLANANAELLQRLVLAMIDYSNWSDQDEKGMDEYRADLQNLFQGLSKLAKKAKNTQKHLFIWALI